MRETRAERVTDTIVFKHKKITNPAVSAADVIAATAAKLTDAIKNNMAQDLTPLDMHELERLADIFQQAAKKVSETNARTPRVATPPRVPTDHEKDQLQPDATLRGWTIGHHDTIYGVGKVMGISPRTQCYRLWSYLHENSKHETWQRGNFQRSSFKI
jgi:hypothetical protein